MGAAFAFELALAPALDFFEVFFDVFLDVFFAVFFAGRPDGPLAARFAALAAAGRGVRRRADFFDADFFFAFAGLFFVVFFLATAILLCRRPDHTIGFLSRRHEDRVVIAPTPGGVDIRILPLAGKRSWRWRMALAGAAVAAAALAGSIRLAAAWENGLRRGEFTDLPLPILLLLSVSVVGSTPFALAGLAALAFAEERIFVSAEEIRIDTTAWERTRTVRIPRVDLDCWRETRLPLSPWWTWAVKRLAASAGGRLHPVAGAAGPREKRRIGLELARATGKPLLADFGKRLD